MRRLAALALVALLGGCTARISGSNGAENGSTAPGAAGGGASPQGPGSCSSQGPVDARVWRLTNAEYRASLQDLLERATPPEVELEVEPIVDGYDNNAAALSVSTRFAAQLQAAAAHLAPEGLVLFARHSGCEQTALTDEACVSRFVSSFGQKAFRRPLTSDEVNGYLAVYRAGVQDEHAARGVLLVVETLLQSPHLLYRSELGDAASRDAVGVASLNAHELASALSYSLWGMPPDQLLLDAAGSGGLNAPQELEIQAKRLLGDARARSRIAEFASRWLAVQKPENLVRSVELFPDFERDKPAMFADFRALAQASFLEAGATLAGIFSNPQAASVEPERMGLLTAPAVIASWSRDQDTAPMTRGKNLLQRVLCQTLPPPPAELKVTAIPQLATATTRQRYEAHVSDPACSGCHAPLDAVAFALEHFDSVGRYRDSEQGLAIDASGALSGGDFAGPFADVRELGQRLAASQDARGCLSQHYARFAIGGGQAGDDECLVERMTQAAALQGDSAPALLLALVTSDSFRRRRLPE